MKEFLAYYRLLLTEIWSDVRRFFRSTWRNWVLAILAFAAPVIWLGIDRAVATRGEATLWTLIALVVLLGGYVGYAVAVASVRIYRCQRQRVAQLELQVTELTAPVIPALTLTPRTRRRDEFEGLPHLMWAGFEIHNDTGQTLTDVEVRICDVIVPHDMDHQIGERRTNLLGRPWEPVQLVWSVGNAEPNQARITIPAGATRTLDVAYCDNSNGTPAFLAIFNENHGFDPTKPVNARRLREMPQRVDIEVYCPDAPTQAESFMLECHGDKLVDLTPDRPPGQKHFTWLKGTAGFEFDRWSDFLPNLGQLIAEHGITLTIPEVETTDEDEEGSPMEE